MQRQAAKPRNKQKLNHRANGNSNKAILIPMYSKLHLALDAANIYHIFFKRKPVRRKKEGRKKKRSRPWRTS